MSQSKWDSQAIGWSQGHTKSQETGHTEFLQQRGRASSGPAKGHGLQKAIGVSGWAKPGNQ